jgi:phytoene desaturase
MLHLRPRNRFEDVDSVYLVGGGTHPGSGLPVIFESARITSRLIGEELGIAVPVDGDGRGDGGCRSQNSMLCPASQSSEPYNDLVEVA